MLQTSFPVFAVFLARPSRRNNLKVKRKLLLGQSAIATELAKTEGRNHLRPVTCVISTDS